MATCIHYRMGPHHGARSNSILTCFRVAPEKDIESRTQSSAAIWHLGGKCLEIVRIVSMGVTSIAP